MSYTRVADESFLYQDTCEEAGMEWTLGSCYPRCPAGYEEAGKVCHKPLITIADDSKAYTDVFHKEAAVMVSITPELSLSELQIFGLLSALLIGLYIRR